MQQMSLFSLQKMVFVEWSIVQIYFSLKIRKNYTTAFFSRNSRNTCTERDSLQLLITEITFLIEHTKIISLVAHNLMAEIK